MKRKIKKNDKVIMKRKIKKNDQVIVTTGRDKGKIGIVKQIITQSYRAIVDGVNKVVCFNKKTKEGMTSKEATIHISNLAHIDPVSQKPTKVKVVIDGDVKKLIAKKSGKEIRKV